MHIFIILSSTKKRLILRRFLVLIKFCVQKLRDLVTSSFVLFRSNPANWRDTKLLFKVKEPSPYFVLDKIIDSVISQTRRFAKIFQFELFHEQLPLPVPCYDLVPVTELTLTEHIKHLRSSDFLSAKKMLCARLRVLPAPLT